MAERLVKVREFNPEQRAGLGEIGWTFNIEVQPVSIGRLYRVEATRLFFDYVTGVEQITGAIPVARQVAVNLKQLALSNSRGLSFNDQLEVVDKAGRKLRKQSLRSGTLEGVDFGIDRASVLAQLDFEHQRRFDGKKLFLDFVSRAIEKYVDLECNPFVAGVGRWGPRDPLLVSAWSFGEGAPFLQVVLVATPSGDR